MYGWSGTSSDTGDEATNLTVILVRNMIDFNCIFFFEQRKYKKR